MSQDLKVPNSDSVTNSPALRIFVSLLLACFCFLSPLAWAGPPYITDDPEPPELGHWEIFLAGLSEATPQEGLLTLPQFDINYGVMKDLQATVTFTFVDALKPHALGPYGLGDTTLGLKYRFLHESQELPEAAFFPQIVLPSGDAAEGLGEGGTQLLLPLWFQKNWQGMESFWGGGYTLNPGPGNLNWLLLGWALQFDLNAKISVGAELLYHTPEFSGQNPGLGSNLAAIYRLDSENQTHGLCGPRPHRR